VEISLSDSFILGIRPDIRMSGDIAGTPGCTIIGPLGKITIDRGVIVAARHVHLSLEQAAAYGIKNGDVISLKVPPPRQGIIGNIVARVGKEFDLEVHFDTDEANGNGLSTGALLEKL
jgi:putative phosphotransacetylase